MKKYLIQRVVSFKYPNKSILRKQIKNIFPPNISYIRLFLLTVKYSEAMKWGITTNFCVKKVYLPCAVKISFLHTKVCGNAIPIIRGFNVQISIYSRAGFFVYFMQIPAFYLFCRKSSNIFE